jgi:predicted RNA-binding Zn-ribbon protein involved in translation (DUF1610 family)
MDAINFFESVEYLEKPKCPKCGSDIDYGLTTTYKEKLKAHTCNECGEILK